MAARGDRSIDSGVPGPAERGRRETILAAAVESVTFDGYARTSMSQVARRAGLPRPLVQYYFPTLELLLQGAIEAISEGWRKAYFEQTRAAASTQPISISEGVDRLWAHMHNPLFRAYQELLSAARTDPQLADIAANAPVSVVESLKIARLATDHPEAYMIALSSAATRTVMQTQDAKEGPRAFVERRAPVWQGR